MRMDKGFNVQFENLFGFAAASREYNENEPLKSGQNKNF